MAIRIEVIAELNDREAVRTADQLADDLERRGTAAGEKYGSGFGKGIENATPKVQRSFTALEAATQRATAAQAEYDKQLNASGFQHDNLVTAADRTSAAMARQANATLAVREAEYRLSQFRQQGIVDAEKQAILIEKVAAAKRNEENSTRTVNAAYIAESKARQTALAEGEKLLLQSKNVSIARLREGDASRAAAAALRDFQSGVRKAAEEAQNAERGFSGFGRSFEGIANALVPGSSVGSAALPIVGALVQLIPVVASASQALFTLPAAAGAAAVGLGTLKLATLGFDDAMKNIDDPAKFATALQTLSPNAQQAALSIRSLIPVFDQLQRATQDSFSAGFGQQINRLTNEYLPSIQKATTGIAAAFNSMLSNISTELMTPETNTSIQTFLTNTTRAFQALAPAAAPFTNAIGHLLEVGSTELPKFSAGIVGLADKFSTFVNTAAGSGKLQHWMDEGLNTLTELSGVAENFVEKFMGLAPLGDKILPDIVTALNETVDVLPTIIKSATEGGGIFHLWTDVLTDLDPLLKGINFTLDLTNVSIGDTHKNLADLINPLDMIATIINGIKWFFDPETRDDAKHRALDKLNAARATKGLGPVDENGKPTGHQGDPGDLDKRNAERAAIGLPPVDENGKPTGVPGVPPGGFRLPTGNKVSGWSGTQMTGVGAAEWGAVMTASGAGGVAPKPKVPKFDAPTGQWSLDNIPIGQFGHGVPAIGAAPVLPPGPQGTVDPEKVFTAQTAVDQGRQSVEEKRRAVLKLEADNNATQDDIIRAKNEEAIAERELLAKQYKLTEEQRGTTKKLKEGMDSLGAALDPDFGLSKGLAGLAENLTKFLGNLIAMPELIKLNAIANMPGQAQGGYGLIGIAGAQGTFGPQYTAAGQAAADASGGVYPGASTTPGFTAGSAYPGDAALLANVPSGKYGRELGSDLTKGLGDCSSAVADLVNILQGQPTAGGDMSTGTEAQWLTSRGFQPTDQPVPGSLQVGFNADHTQATLPGGTQFNWGNSTDAANGGIAPNSGGAWMPGFTSHYYLPVDGTPGGPASGVPGSGAAPLSAGSGVVPVFVTNMGGGGMTGAGPPPVGSPASGNGAGPAPGGGNRNWDALAAKESNGNWANKSNPKYSGGLQFDQGTWNAYKPPGAPDNAADATKDQQIQAGQNALAQGRTPQSLWPVNYGQLNTALPSNDLYGPANTSPGLNNPPAPGLPATVPGAGSGGPMPTTPFNPFGSPALPDVSGSETINNASGTVLGAPLAQGPTAMPGGGPGFLPGSPYVGAPDWPGGATTPAPGSIGGFPVPNAVANTQGMPGASALTPLTAPGAPGSPPGASGWGAGGGPTKIGGVAPPGSISPGGGGVGLTPGGTIDTAIGAAAGGLDLIAPGAGQAAQTGIKLANRAIQYAGQLAGIGVSGLMETFLPTGGSELANNSWFTRLAGAAAGAAPALPNIAGGKKDGKDGNKPQGPLSPEDAAKYAASLAPGQQGGNNVNVQYDVHGQTEDQNGKSLAWHLNQAAQPAGMH